MQRIAITIVYAAIFLALTSAAHAAWKSVDPAEGRRRLAAGGGVADFYFADVGRRRGETYECEFGSWGSIGGKNLIQADFCWTDGFIGWDGSLNGRDSFFNAFENTDHKSVRATAAPSVVIHSAVGKIKTVGFDKDITRPTSQDEDRGCVGFAVGWKSLNRSYTRLLRFYACGNGYLMMPEKTFRSILAGFSIDGFFDQLVE